MRRKIVSLKLRSVAEIDLYDYPLALQRLLIGGTFLQEIYVKSEHRGNGLASQAIRDFLSKRRKPVVLEVSPFENGQKLTLKEYNVRSKRLVAWYKTLGFVQVYDYDCLMYWLPTQRRLSRAA